MLQYKYNEIKHLKSCRKGKANAFEPIVRHYQPLVCAITYSRTGNRHLSEELAQEIFVKAWTNLHQLKDLSKFRVWLCRIAETTVQNWYRSHKRDVVSRSSPLDAVREQGGTESNPEAKTILKEQETLVRQALQELPNDHREVLVLYYREQQSTRQVAQQLGLSEGAVRQRISRSRQMLQDKLQSIVADTLKQTRPTDLFTTAVIASVASLTMNKTASAGLLSGFVHKISAKALSLGTLDKLALTAAGITIIVGGVTLLSRPSSPPEHQPNKIPSVEHLPENRKSLSQSPINVQNNQPVRTSSSSQLPNNQTVMEFESLASLQLNSEASPYVFKPQGVLSGLVTDKETGEPVVGACVELDTYPRREVETDRHGFYCFKDINGVQQCRVRVSSQTHVDMEREGANRSRLQLVPEVQVVKHFQLVRGCPLTVQVVDANDVGVAHVQVLVAAPDDLQNQSAGFLGSSRQGKPTRTDANGVVDLGPLPIIDTDYMVQAWTEPLENIQKDLLTIQDVNQLYPYAPAYTRVRLSDPEIHSQIKMLLERGESVFGYVECSDQVPATEARIRVCPSWWQGNEYRLPSYPVDDDGTFELCHTLAGGYLISVYFPTDPNVLGTSLGVRTDLDVSLPLPDQAPLQIHLPDVSSLNCESIQGVLSISNVSYPMEVCLSLSHEGSTTSIGTTLWSDTNIIRQPFCFSYLTPGTYKLSISGDRLETFTLEGIEASSTELEINLEPIIAKQTLTGIVTDADSGLPIKQYELRAYRLKGLYGLDSVETPRQYGFNDPRGQFEISIELAIYQLEVIAKGYAPQWIHDINTEIDETVHVQLSRGGSVTGRVLDAAGKRISGATVIPLCYAHAIDVYGQSLFANQKGAVTTVKGEFTLANISPGLETLKVIHPDFAPCLVESVEVLEGQTTAEVDIVLQSGGGLEGTVYDNQGNPVANQRLFFLGDCETKQLNLLEYADNHQWGTTVTDSHGYYQINHLPEQPCTIYRGNHKTALGVVRQSIIPRDGVVLKCDLGAGAIVSGTILIDGKPLENGRVLLASENSRYLGNPMCFAQSDEQGFFLFGGVTPGVHSIYYRFPEPSKIDCTIATFEMTEENADLGIINYQTE